MEFTLKKILFLILIKNDHNSIYFNNFIKDKPVKKQKLEHGKHAAQDQEKENGF